MKATDIKPGDLFKSATQEGHIIQIIAIDWDRFSLMLGEFTPFFCMTLTINPGKDWLPAWSFEKAFYVPVSDEKTNE